MSDPAGMGQVLTTSPEPRWRPTAPAASGRSTPRRERASVMQGGPGVGIRMALALAASVAGAGEAWAQAQLSGRVSVLRHADLADRLYLGGVLCFAGQKGPGREPAGFRTWETDPAGWYRLEAGAGNHTVVFTQPASFIRPVVLNNLFLAAGERVDGLQVTPRLDLANFAEKEWDAKPGQRYFQTFSARGWAVTQVGFRLAHDGVDGMGPKRQNLVVSVHRRGPDASGTPDTWPQVGPAGLVRDVDSGGAKNYLWSAGWNSGEVPLEPGGTYAVQLRTETDGGSFQPFWRTLTPGEPGGDCFRVGTNGIGFQGRQLWMAVATDGDGLRLPYNKRVHKEYGAFAGMASKWAQTYVAQGRGLASVLMYAAVSGAQPPLSRQRVVVRVRRGGPDGPVVGVEKIGIGNGDYTGDASWGRFGAVFAPGEVPLEPGALYAIEWESLENHETLDGFVNIKGQVSDGRPGFNPYRKQPGDDEPAGRAYRWGTNAMDFDLDLQVIEYEHGVPAAVAGRDEAPAGAWEFATDRENLLRNGGFQIGEATAGDAVGSRIDGWKPFALDPGTTHAFVIDGTEKTNRVARVLGGGWNGRTVDGGFVQRVDGLARTNTYRLSGRLRSSWALDLAHQCFVGIDSTGQETNGAASSISWTAWPPRHGVWVPYLGDPVRPATNAVSVWLRGRTTHTGDRHAPFKADFDDFALRRVRTEVPTTSR